MFDWLENSNFYFFTQAQPEGGYDIYIQTALTAFAAIIGAIAGAFSTDYVRKSTEEKLHTRVELKKLNSLAISTLYKLSRASSSQLGLGRAFFSSIPDGTPAQDNWRFVLPAVPINPEIWKLSEEEFEFLLPEGGDTSLAYSIVELLDFAEVNIRAINEYSLQRRTLADALDPHTEEINTDDGYIGSALNLDAYPDIKRKIVEISVLCNLVKKNIDEAIKLSENISENLNPQLPILTKNEKFSKFLSIQPIVEDEGQVGQIGDC